MVSLRCQTLEAATQFDGTAAKGFWDFSDWDHIPRTTRIVLLSISYHEPNPVDIALTVNIWLSRPGGLATERMPLEFGLADPAKGNLLNPITAAGELRACGITLPRDLPPDISDPGQHWQLHLETADKVNDATACCDWMLCPFPDTDARDSRDK